jgi:hypothetical protein
MQFRTRLSAFVIALASMGYSADDGLSASRLNLYDSLRRIESDLVSLAGVDGSLLRSASGNDFHGETAMGWQLFASPHTYVKFSGLTDGSAQPGLVAVRFQQNSLRDGVFQFVNRQSEQAVKAGLYERNRHLFEETVVNGLIRTANELNLRFDATLADFSVYPGAREDRVIVRLLCLRQGLVGNEIEVEVTPGGLVKSFSCYVGVTRDEVVPTQINYEQAMAIAQREVESRVFHGEHTTPYLSLEACQNVVTSIELRYCMDSEVAPDQAAPNALRDKGAAYPVYIIKFMEKDPRDHSGREPIHIYGMMIDGVNGNIDFSRNIQTFSSPEILSPISTKEAGQWVQWYPVSSPKTIEWGPMRAIHFASGQKLEGWVSKCGLFTRLFIGGQARIYQRLTRN